MILTPGNDAQERTFVVVGVQRGGTSMVAGVMRELGINLGKNLGSNHEDPEFLSMDVDEILGKVEKRNSEHDVWGWKVPHSSVYIADIQHKLRNAHVIVVFRNLLAMAESQMKRSTTTFENAFEFSKNRLIQVSEILHEIEVPLMLVDYDTALRKPENFISELIEFTGIDSSETSRQNALSLIDPQKGYQRISTENWQFSVVNGKAIQQSKQNPLESHRRLMNLFPEDNVLKKSDENAFIEFMISDTLNKDEINVDLTRNGFADKVSIIVDLGNGYSANMRERIQLYKGRNRIIIKKGGIRGVRIYPSFDGVVSNISLVTIGA